MAFLSNMIPLISAATSSNGDSGALVAMNVVNRSVTAIESCVLLVGCIQKIINSQAGGLTLHRDVSLKFDSERDKVSKRGDSI